MRIAVCIKEVLDPDAVNNFALAGRLVIGDDGKTLTQAAIPRLINGYDEQAIEAALRIRDTGLECTISAVSLGEDPAGVLRQAAALGADEIAAIPIDPAAIDHHVVAALLAGWVRSTGGAELVLCGRQASDDDQAVVPVLLAEHLGTPVITVARKVEWLDTGEGPSVRVTRVTPDGDEVVEASCPVVVTISSEIGEPRYPTAARKLAARRIKATSVDVAALSLSARDLVPRFSVLRQFVPAVQGDCEFVSGETPAAVAERLVQKLRQDGVLS